MSSLLSSPYPEGGGLSGDYSSPAIILPGPLACALRDRDRLNRVRAAGVDLVSSWQAREDVLALQQQLIAMDAVLPPDAEAFAAALSPWLDNDLWYRNLIEQGCLSMADDPLAEVPLGMQSGGVMQALALVEAGGACATLAQVNAAMLAMQAASGAAPTVVFGSGYSLVVLLAGTMAVELWCLDRALGRISHVRSWEMRGGDHIALDNRTEQLLIRSAPRDAVLLNLCVTGPERREPTLEFDVVSGNLLRRGMADPVVSRMLLLTALVPAARTEERDALFNALSRDAEPLLRWQAMRHWLAAGARGAVPRLEAMAREDPDASVRAAAQATLGLLARMAGEAHDAG